MTELIMKSDGGWSATIKDGESRSHSVDGLVIDPSPYHVIVTVSTLSSCAKIKRNNSYIGCRDSQRRRNLSEI
jgi:hypothetical protein